MSSMTDLSYNPETDTYYTDPRTDLIRSLTESQKTFILDHIAKAKAMAFDNAVIALFDHERQMARAMADMFPNTDVEPPF